MNGETTMTVTSPPGRPDTESPLRMTTGRWLALAVAVPVALALIGWTGFSLVAATAKGSYPFSYAVPVQDGQVALSVNSGNVTLREAPGSSAARLTGTVQYGLFRPDISEYTTPTGASLGLDCSGASALNGSCGATAVLDVPARTAVTLWSNGGDIAASGSASGTSLLAGGGNITASSLTGAIQLDTQGGDLTASGLTGTLQIGTEGGNITGGGWAATGTARVDTGGGDLNLDGLTGDLQLAAEGGNVEASGVSSAVSSIQSGGGDVTLAYTQAPQNLQISADGGNVTVILPPGGTRYDISTPDTSGGNVSYPAALADPASPRTITVDSGGGDITISQG
jgi:Putative adhesin